MAAFDPVAATAAYMAELSPAGHAKATAYTQGGHWILLWAWLVSVVITVLIVRSGVLARLEERIEAKKARPILTSFLVVLIFQIIDTVLSLPWAIYADWWREKSYGLNNQTLGAWLGETAMSAAISALIFSLFMIALYALIRRAPKTWWAWAGGLAVVFVVIGMIAAPVFIEPLFNKYTPAPAGEVRDQVVALAKATGTPSDKIFIFDGSKQSNRYTANVSGLFGSARVAMSDVMFKKGADLAEVRGVVGHEMGHYVRGHILWMTLAISIMAVVGFWLASLLFAPVAMFLRADVGGIADPAGIPIIMIILATLGLLATPLTNTLTRLQEADADHFSLVHANEPDGLSKALVKTIEYRASSPSALEEFVFYDHPSVEHRVRKAMDWKAAHMTPQTPQPVQ